MMCNTSSVPGHGFTLVEVLLALMLSGLVLAVTARLVRYNMVVENSLQTSDRARVGEDALLDFLRQDIDHLMKPEPGAEAIAMPEGVVVQLRTLARFDDPEVMQSLLLPADVTYILEAGKDRSQLVRVRKDLTDLEAASGRMVIMRDVQSAVCGFVTREKEVEGLTTGKVPRRSAVELRVVRTSGRELSQRFLLPWSIEKEHEVQRGYRPKN